MKSVDKFPAIKDFHLPLDISENKIRLQTVLQSGFQNAAQRSAVEIIYCVGDCAQNLSIGQFASEYSHLYADADTAMFYIYIVLSRDRATQRLSFSIQMTQIITFR